MTAITLREWERRPLAPGLLGSAELQALAGLPPHAFRVIERRGQIELRACAHVGRVQVGRLTITVIPKLAEQPLLRLLAYAHDLEDLKLAALTEYGGGPLLQDLLAEQLRRHAQAIIDHGLHRDYRRVSRELAAPRGRVDMAALARRVPLLRAALPCIDHERATDHRLNRVLLAGLALAARVVVHAPLRVQLRELAAQLGDEVQRVPLTRPQLAAARRSLHRLVSRYRPALELITLLHAGCGLDLTDAPRESTAAGFLFDMNRFFQALTLKLLTEELPDCEVQAEHKLTGAYRWARPALPARRQPRPRPDITVVRGDERVLLDAKYRDLSVGPLPREILYQLTVYAASQGPGGEAAILYPKHEAPALAEERLELFAPGGSVAHAAVLLRPVPLVELAASVAAGDSGAAFRRTLARTLAFGAV